MENIKIEYTEDEKDLINATLLKGCSEFEKLQVWHMANKYGLDLMQKGQIWVSGFGNQKNIIVGRDGQLTIAHRQGLKSLITTCEYSSDDLEHRHPISATCVVERFDGGHFEATAVFADYNSNQALWKTKPSEMIGKVAESKVLRRAFDMSGFYAQEELDEAKAEALNIKELSVEEEEKIDAGKGNALFTPRKEREAAKVAEQPKVETKITENTAQIKVEVPKEVPKKEGEAVSGDDPENVRKFNVFCENLYNMTRYRVTEDEKKAVLGTPGDLSAKIQVIRERVLKESK